MKLDSFAKNIILVFLGTALLNFFNFLYQLLMAHKFSPEDFAAFNSLLSLSVLVGTPLVAVSTAITKYTAEFNARGELSKIRVLLSGFFKIGLVSSLALILIFSVSAPWIMSSLKIPSLSAVYLFAVLIGVSCLSAVVNGGLQGLESFAWVMASSVISAFSKLFFALAVVIFGLGISGALSGFILSTLLAVVIVVYPLRGIITFGALGEKADYKGIFAYTLPVAVNTFCFSAMVNMDMVMVKHYFEPYQAGIYSLSQMLGKVFLFLPAAIFMVMFPRASHLNAKNDSTLHILNRSILYAGALCLVAFSFYNIFPVFSLKILTGKSFSESIALGRFFSVSMSFFALYWVISLYFLSLKDTRFLKYAVFFTVIQFIAIIFFHSSLYQVQLALCVNSITLFIISLRLAYKRKG